MPTLTIFHWDDVNDCVLEETDGSGSTIVTYTHEPGAYGPLISEYRAGTTSTHHYDALGNTQFLTDDSGNVTDTYDYDAWGNTVATTGTTPTPYQWAGRHGYQYDTATDAYYVRARTFLPSVARWISIDPLWPQLEDAAYIYVNSSPVNLNDPSGLRWLPFPRTGTPTLYFSDSAGDSLTDLANLVANDQSEWVCIWPVGGRDFWADYPNTSKPCAQADVSNLVSTSGLTQVVSPRVNQDDLYLKAFRKISKEPDSVWTSGQNAALRLKTVTGQGKTPLSRYVVGGHGAIMNNNICDSTGHNCYSYLDVLRIADEPDNLSNSYEHASQQIGPPRCWFIRGGRIWGAACYSETAWTSTWKTYIAGPRTKVLGYDDELQGWNGTPTYMYFEGHNATHYKTLSGFLGSGFWILQD